MSKRKYFLTVRFETKEDFDKHYDNIYNPAYKQGYEEGLQDALARMIYAFDNEFDSKDIARAEQSQRSLGISRYKKQRDFEDGVKRLAINEYLEKLEQKENENG